MIHYLKALPEYFIEVARGTVSNMKIELDRLELTLLLTALSVISECAKIDGDRCTAIDCLRETIKEQVEEAEYNE